MNDYTMMINSYKHLAEKGKISKELAEKEIRIYEILSSCDKEDLCRMVDSGAFNDIIRGYLKLAVENADISAEDKVKIRLQLSQAFDEKTAKDVLNQ